MKTDTDSLPSILREKVDQWSESIRSTRLVKDSFPLRDKTALVILKPGDVGVNPNVIRDQMADFAHRLDDKSKELLGVRPLGPEFVEPNPKRRPYCFYRGAFLMADGMEPPPFEDDDA
jgi:hypothetical protein